MASSSSRSESYLTMDVEYFCSYASDVLYGYHDTEIILMSFIVLVGKFVVGQEINMLLVMMQH